MADLLTELTNLMIAGKTTITDAIANELQNKSNNPDGPQISVHQHDIMRMLVERLSHDQKARLMGMIGQGNIPNSNREETNPASSPVGFSGGFPAGDSTSSSANPPVASDSDDMPKPHP